jgi:uncharacterized phosphosugar-binding protein
MSVQAEGALRSREYVDALKRNMNDLCEESERFEAAAKLIVDSATNGGQLYVHDPANTIMYEAAGRAAGLYMTRLLRVADVPSLRHSSNDVVIVFSNNLDLSGLVRLLQQVRKRGAHVVGVSPRLPGHRSPSLADYADITIDNGLRQTVEGMLSLDGFEKRIGSLEHVVNCTVIFALCAATIGEFLRRGLKPSVYMSLRAHGSREYDGRIWDQYRRQGF